MFSKTQETERTLQLAETFKNRLSSYMDRDEKGQLKMNITLPDESVLNNLAKSLAQILGPSWKQCVLPVSLRRGGTGPRRD
jgi:hypothetical protein